MSGWTNQIPFPFIVVDPTTGSPVFEIDSLGAHVISPTNGIDLVQGVGSPPPAEIKFTDLSGTAADPAIIDSQNISGGMSLGLSSGEGSVGSANGGFAFIQLDPTHAVIEYDDVTSPNSGTTRVELTSSTVNFIGRAAVASDDAWHDVTLLNGWANRVGFNHLSYRIDITGRVYFRGSISGGTSVSGTQIGTVPAGYRPAGSEELMPIVSDNLPAAYAPASARLRVLTTGEMFIYTTGAGPLYFSGANYSTV